VTFGPEVLLERLDALETAGNKPDRYVIALSGGLDSAVLAHALAVTRRRHGKSLLAVHVDHQLHPESGSWNEHCRRLADALGIQFVAETVSVDTDAGIGIEAAARAARYDALALHAGERDWLLSAHHRNDQAETLLLNLMRGSGPSGLAGIGLLTQFAGGWLARPFIDVSRAALEAYAAEYDLRWVDDPSNADLRFDRNYLRHDVIPALEQRWPGVVERLARSAELASEAASLLDELAATDLQSIGDRAARIDIAGLLTLSNARQRNLLRHAVRQAGLPAPGAARLATVLESVLQAREDAQPRVAWQGAEARRYRGKLYLLPPLGELPWPPEGRPLTGSPLWLGPGMGVLRPVPGAPRGLSSATVGRGLSIRMREGGEQIKPVGQEHTKKLKKLLQEEGVVPWMRERLPLIYADEKLVAVADLWIAADAASEPGTALCWDERPELY
jgi:tRNA(Ile)-lysidine synthase